MLELQRRLSAAGSPIISAGAQPGVAMTNLQSNMTGLFKILGPLLEPLVAQDTAYSALPTLFAAPALDVTRSGYYGPNGFNEKKGYPVPAKIPPSVKNMAIAGLMA